MFRALFLFGVLFFTNAGFVSAEVIRDFSIEYVIQADATVEVTETITYDFEGASRHGIFRTLEKDHPQSPTAWYKNRYVGIEVQSVTRDGVNEPFLLTDSKPELEIRIGDANQTITGLHEYKITYSLTGALSYGSVGSEFYWNATGNNWQVYIDKVTAVVKSNPPSILSGMTACYQGYIGSSLACKNIESSPGQVIFSANDIASGEGLTIATELDPNAVAFVTTERTSYLPFGFAFATMWLIFFAFKVYRFRTQAKVKLPVIAQYEPFENYLPMYTGVLFDGNLDPQDITAGILYLAEQGFIKIKKTEKKVLLFFNTTDYEITLLRKVSEMPTEFLRELSGLLFDVNDTPPVTVMLSNLIKKRVENAKIVRSLQASLKKDLVSSGFHINSWPKFGWLVIVAPIILLGIFVLLGEPESGIILLFYTLIPSVLMTVMLAVARRTKRGYEVKNHLEGFKLFLSVTDKERFAFHNAPEKSPELFMKYLPYAVALGVEKKWAKVFEGITIPQPDWYEGGNIGHFSATALTSDIGAFSTSFSASSGTSGSSGGGSSGGGGGGGGGGSW